MLTVIHLKQDMKRTLQTGLLIILKFLRMCLIAIIIPNFKKTRRITLEVSNFKRFNCNNWKFISIIQQFLPYISSMIIPQRDHNSLLPTIQTSISSIWSNIRPKLPVQKIKYTHVLSAIVISRLGTMSLLLFLRMLIVGETLWTTPITSGINNDVKGLITQKNERTGKYSFVDSKTGSYLQAPSHWHKDPTLQSQQIWILLQG